MLGRATAFVENGESEDALKQFDSILVEFPTSVGALYSRADLVKFKADDPALRKMHDLIRPNATQSDSDRMSLHFALGKAFLDMGQSDNAFRHFNDGNRMKRALIQYDANATSQWLASISQAMTADILEKFKGQGDPSKMPIFVIGMPRSGTTLIEQILSSHTRSR